MVFEKKTVDLTGMEPDDIETLVISTLRAHLPGERQIQFIKYINGVTYDVTGWPLDEMMYEGSENK